MTRLKVELPPEHGATQAAREAIRATYADAVRAPTLSDLLLIVTELVANSVTHAHTDVICVEVDVRAEGTVVGIVEDSGRDARVQARQIDPSVGRGLGLHIVDALADRWTVATGDGTLVRFELNPV
jgi:anti-sigma regulatory factor (Ser/Thr protein kinase)